MRENWLLIPCAIVLGSAYGISLVAGLLEVQRLAPERGLAALTATFYVFTYLGFAAPYLLALAAHAASYSLLLAVMAGLALLTAGSIRVASAEKVPSGEPALVRMRSV